MVNYQNGKIYKLISLTNPDSKPYIGSTCQSLAKRKGGHRNQFNTFKKNDKQFMSSFSLFEKGAVDIVLLEKSPCDSREELHSRERHYIESMDCVNQRIPTRKPKEYREKYRALIQEKKKVKVVCDCGSEIRINDFARHKRSKKHISFEMNT